MPKPIKTITILGKRYSIKFVPNLGDKYGDCDSPKEKDKAIRIRQGLSQAELLETIIHECFHAGHWNIEEEHVAAFCKDLTAVLIRLGYRKQD